MSIDAVLDIARTLLDEGVDPVPRSLELAAEIAEHGRADEILSRVISDGTRRSALLELVSSLDHVGFLVPTVSKANVSDAAAAAGFDEVHTIFQSTILARELGELSGQSTVPTTVLKARGTAPGGRPIIVEVFMPHAEPHSVRGWIRAGVGPHLAFCVRTLTDLTTLTQLVEAEGFRLPPFMRERPMTNDAERVTTLYFDGHFQEHLLRLEFCHYA